MEEVKEWEGCVESSSMREDSSPSHSLWRSLDLIFPHFLLFGKKRSQKNEAGLCPAPAALPTAFLEPSGIFSSYKRDADGTRIPSAGGWKRRTLGSLSLGRGRRPRRPETRRFLSPFGDVYAFLFSGGPRPSPTEVAARRLPTTLVGVGALDDPRHGGFSSPFGGGVRFVLRDGAVRRKRTVHTVQKIV